MSSCLSDRPKWADANAQFKALKTGIAGKPPTACGLVRFKLQIAHNAK